MTWLGRTLVSSIGKKLLMAASGLFLGLFVLVHLLGNTTALAGREAFLAYAAALHAYDAILVVFELLLLVILLFHVITAVSLYFANRAARPIPYAAPLKAGGRSWGSRSMLYSGLVILAFLLVHLYQFKLAAGELAVADLVRQTLQNPLIAGFYLLGVLALALHFSHGCWSLWQSLGIEHPKYNGLLQRGAWLLALLIALFYSLIPLGALFCPAFLV